MATEEMPNRHGPSTSGVNVVRNRAPKRGSRSGSSGSAVHIWRDEEASIVRSGTDDGFAAAAGSSKNSMTIGLQSAGSRGGNRL